GTDIIGEEQAAADPSCLALIEGDRPVFIIDPIDGTGNYAADLPLFGVMVALVHRNRTLAGFIHDPVGDDTAIGLVGEPAWIEQRDGDKALLQVAPPVPVGQMAGAISWRFLPEPYRTRIMNRLRPHLAVGSCRGGVNPSPGRRLCGEIRWRALAAQRPRGRADSRTGSAKLGGAA
ncbi:MAG: hypothetical protein B7Z71_13855, partial [Acidocella sp. 21-58-7]